MTTRTRKKVTRKLPTEYTVLDKPDDRCLLYTIEVVVSTKNETSFVDSLDRYLCGLREYGAARVVRKQIAAGDFDHNADILDRRNQWHDDL